MNNFKCCIIDADPLVYRCGFAIQKRNKDTDIIHIEHIQHAYFNVNSMIKKTINRCGTDNIKLFLTESDRSNFRFDIYPKYKDNRKDAEKPIYYDELRDYIVKKYNAEIISGQEADDACSILHYKLNPFGHEEEFNNSVVCSFDKDFNNLAGWHYNYVKDELYFLSEIQALRNFYLQILTGDKSDGIPRIKKGWRQIKVEEQLQKALTERELYDIVYIQIQDLMRDNVESINWIHSLPFDQKNSRQEIYQRGQLVWLRRKENEFWRPFGEDVYVKENT